MSYEVLLDPSGHRAKVRNPWAVFGFSIVTGFIYTCFWWYLINRELAAYGRTKGIDLGSKPWLSALAFTFGVVVIWLVIIFVNQPVNPILVVIPLVWTIVTTTRRLQKAQVASGEQDPLSGWVASAVWIFVGVIAGPSYTQWHLNKVWEKEPKLAPQATALPNGEPDLERLEKLAALRDSGALTEEEFASEKARILPSVKPARDGGNEKVATQVDRPISGVEEVADQAVPEAD
jgi:hypothetical protein